MGSEISWADAHRRLTLRLANGSRTRPPLPRDFVVRLVPGKAIQWIRFAGEPVDVGF
jgi:hypothetical protein